MNKLKQNKGITLSDISISIVVLMIFVGIIGTLYYQIVRKNNSIYMNAIATDYAIKIAEYVDKISYSEVNNELNEKIKNEFEILDLYNISINVENYNDIDNTKNDIIKIVHININYSFLNDNMTYELSKLKIKEM